mgnify:CR=1 FL=1|jgi:hypothetical protein
MINLNLSKCKGFVAHRSGWSFCMNALRPFHSKSGIFVDDFVERSFSWDMGEFHFGENPHKLPYKTDWIGFIHNPPNVPEWFDIYNSPQAILSRDVFQQSLKSCKCLITLSNYLKDWLEPRVDVPLVSVKHPTEIPAKKWEPHKFMQNSRPPVIQIGYWLRKMEAILNLQTSYPYRKVWMPSNPNYGSKMLSVYEKTQHEFWGKKYRWASVEFMEWLSNEDYDNFLTSGIVFLDLYDASANNAVVECIARNTPLLVNRIPSVVEYCGEDYPLYYDDLDHAASLLQDKQNIFAAHEHFKKMDKRWLSGNYFASEVMNSIEGVLK